jgi:transcriptional regulator with XRE-family HTH domain
MEVGRMDSDGVDGSVGSGELEDDSAAVLQMVGRQIKLWREAAGMTQTELGTAIGYSEEMVSSVERGVRTPQPAFLVGADRVLEAGGKLAAFVPDVAEARYPRKVRNLAKLEAEAVELGAYGNHNIHGLLQTERYARALFDMRRPTYSPDEIDRQVEARMARKAIFDRAPAPTLSFVMEEATLRRPLGGAEVMRGQLQHLLNTARLRHVDIQVMPLRREEHAGMGGQLEVLRLEGGTTLGYTEAQLSSRVHSCSAEAQMLETRYGIIRAQALSPRESLAFIEKVLGET